MELCADSTVIDSSCVHGRPRVEMGANRSSHIYINELHLVKLIQDVSEILQKLVEELGNVCSHRLEWMTETKMDTNVVVICEES